MDLFNQTQITVQFDITSNSSRKLLSSRIADDIDLYCQAALSDGPRTHLGASIIGHECDRYLWNVFRWLKQEQFSGRMLRLFDRGKREESRFVQWLRGIGATVWEFEEDGKQARMSGVGGHYGGSSDGKVQLPARYGLGEMIIGAEFKTNGTGQGFTSLQTSGVRIAKQQHYTQLSCYGRFWRHQYGIYLNTNKNDDDMHVEVIQLDWDLASKMEERAYRVITSQIPLTKVSVTPAYFTCKICHFAGICHRGDAPEINCRSCRNASPIDNAQWHCAKFGQAIPADFIPKGCPQYERIV